MGLSEFLSNARLAYHGYTPEVIDQMRGYLQQKRQEQEWRAFEDRRRLELAEEAGRRAADEAEARRKTEERRQQEDTYKSLYEQLKLLPPGADVTKLMGVETVPVGIVRDIQERVKVERTFAQEQADAERKRKADEERAEDAADEARGLRVYRRHREIDKEFTSPQPPPAETVDPFVSRAMTELDAFRRDPLMAPPELLVPKTVTEGRVSRTVSVVDPSKIDAWVRQRATQLRQVSRDFRGVPGAHTSPLTPDEQAKLAKLPDEDRADAQRVLQGGDPALITELRKRLGAIH